MSIRFALVSLALLSLVGCGSSGSSSPSPTSASSTNSLTASQNHLHSIAILPHNANALYMGAHYNLYRSNDGGKHWRALSRQMMLSIALDSGLPGKLYAVSLQRGLIESTDGGSRWQATTGSISKGKATGVLIDQSAHTVLAYGAGIYRSADGGAHWSHTLADQSIANLAAGGGSVVYAATGSGLDISRDGGRHWKSVASIGNQPVIQVAAVGSVAYAVTPISLLKSSDTGHSWKPLGKAPQGIEFMGVAPTNSNQIFGEVAGQGFSVSHDGGATWHAANNGIHDRNFNASTVSIASSSSNVAYTGAWGLRVYATRDGGAHWTKTATLLH